MTVPRELSLVEDYGSYLLTSNPVNELRNICSEISNGEKVKLNYEMDLSSITESSSGTFKLNLGLEEIQSFSIEISNDQDEKIVIGYDQEENRYYIDRSRSGKVNFHPEFGKIHYAPRMTTKQVLDLQLIVDVASAELFADNGRTVMTSIFFPNKDYSKIKINIDEENYVEEINIRKIASIW